MKNQRPTIPERYRAFKLVLPNYYVRTLVPPLPTSFMFIHQDVPQQINFKLQQLQEDHMQAILDGMPEKQQVIQKA